MCDNTEDEQELGNSGIPGITPAVAKARMRAEYHKIRSQLFPPEHGEPATVQWLHLGEESDVLEWGGSSTSRLLRMIVEGFNLQTSNFNDFPEDADPHEIYQNFGYLPEWRVYLAHEICHEYQFVVLGDQADDWGVATFAERGQHWDGPGHTAAFYTAIRAFADRFSLPVETLLDRL